MYAACRDAFDGFGGEDGAALRASEEDTPSHFAGAVKEIQRALVSAFPEALRPFRRITVFRPQYAASSDAFYVHTCLAKPDRCAVDSCCERSFVVYRNGTIREWAEAPASPV